MGKNEPKRKGILRYLKNNIEKIRRTNRHTTTW